MFSDFRKFNPEFSQFVSTSQTATIYQNPAYLDFGVWRAYCDLDIGDSIVVKNFLLRDVRSGIITSRLLGGSNIPGATSPRPDIGGMYLGSKPLFPTRSFVNSYNFSFEIDEIPLDKYWKKEDLTKPPMKDKCCFSKKDLKKLHRIYQVLAVDEMLEEGFYAPNRLIMEGARGDYFADNYLKIIEFQVRMADHLGIHPITPDFGDVDLIKAGKQTVETRTVNAHAAIKEILENSHKNNTGNEAILRILGALGIALSQLLRATTEAVKRIRGTMLFLGVPLVGKEFKVKMPFNVQALYKYKVTKKKQGKKTVEVKEKVLNTDEKLETILPKFVQNSEQTFLYEGYNDDEPNLIDQLNQNDISNIQ